MDTALIVVGVLLVGILILWLFSYMSDPKQIDEEEEAGVREESPKELEHDEIESAARSVESNADDIAFYSPGDANAE
jgi:hypothetical protein